MKKLIVTLALIGMATLAFGQNLVLSGYLDTGVTVLSNGPDKTYVGLWGDDAAVNGGRVKLIGKYDNGDFGASFETRWDGLLNNIDTSKYQNIGSSNNLFPTAAIPVYFKHAYAQAQFFDKLLLTQVGIVKEESTKTGGNKNFKFATETPGAVVVVKPIADLAIQAFFAPASGTSSVAAEEVAPLVDTQSGLSAAYTVKGIARVAAGALYYSSKYNSYAPSKAYAGVNLYAVPNLTATLEGQIENLNTGVDASKNPTGGDAGKTSIVETLSYNFKDLGLTPLTAGLIAYQYVMGADVKNLNASAKQEAITMSYRIQPSVSWAFDGGITANLGFTYLTGFAVTDTDGYNTDLGKNFGVAKMVNTNLNNIATFEIKPSVKLALTKTQNLTFAYAYVTSTGSDSVTFLTKTLTATNMQTFQTAYTYSF